MRGAKLEEPRVGGFELLELGLDAVGDAVVDRDIGGQRRRWSVGRRRWSGVDGRGCGRRSSDGVTGGGGGRSAG